MPTAVVFGATGAVGSHIVQQLADSSFWTKVTTVGRRAPEAPAARAAGQGGGPAVAHVVVDGDLAAAAAAGAETGGGAVANALSGADAVFCALGTTRAAAGSAAAFVHVDLDCVAAAAAAAKRAGARYFGLVSAQGANANVWASDLAPLHPLLYARTKGQSEEAARAQGFERLSIFRPGLLDRGARARTMERAFARLATSVPAAGVARAMVADAERFLAGSAPAGAKTYEMAALRAAAAAGGAPEPA